MQPSALQSYTAFEETKLLAQGPLDEVALKVKRRLKANHEASILVFSDSTGKEMDFDLRGTEKEMLQRLQVYLSPTDSLPSENTGPGRPKLGVVSREVSLLPRHWEWLSTQTGGASATLRRLIDDARKSSSGREIVKQAQERTHKLMSTLGGNLPNYEEALRAFYAKDKKKFKDQMQDWPADIKEYIQKMAADAF
jgi:uncharacterized protein